MSIPVFMLGVLVGMVIEAYSFRFLRWLFHRKLMRNAQTPSEFVECPTCAAKPGSPILCDECLVRRDRWQAHR